MSKNKVFAFLAFTAVSADGLVRDGNGVSKHITQAEKAASLDDIEDLQTKLKNLAFNNVIASKIFDKNTRQALLDFQKLNALPLTGTILHWKISEYIVKNCLAKECQ